MLLIKVVDMTSCVGACPSCADQDYPGLFRHSELSGTVDVADQGRKNTKSNVTNHTPFADQDHAEQFHRPWLLRHVTVADQVRRHDEKSLYLYVICRSRPF